jgi:2,5-dioxopentanoate dehydrogenase
MSISPSSLVGRTLVAGGPPFFSGFEASTGSPLSPEFGTADDATVNLAGELARAAFDPFRLAPLEERAGLLEDIARDLADLGPVLIERAMSETGLPVGRLQGELQRTVNQLHLFASVVRQGLWIDATLDAAQPERRTAPRPDLRMGRIGLGPVAIRPVRWRQAAP